MDAAPRRWRRDEPPLDPMKTLVVARPEAARDINLQDLPTEVLLIIFEKLRDIDPVTLLGAVPGVSKRFRAVCAGVQGELQLRLNHFATYGERFDKQALYDAQEGALESAATLFSRIKLVAPELDPLHIACEVGSFKLAQKLLKSEDGIREINKVLGERDTPLISACYGGFVDIVRLLIDKGADVDKANDEQLGETPLNIACQVGHLEVARLLLESGADVNKADKYGRTPLRNACDQGRLDVVRLLLEKGPDMDKATNLGETPLFIACLKGRLDAVRLLVENGADLDKARDDGATPLAIALKNNHGEIVSLLRAAGAHE